MLARTLRATPLPAAAPLVGAAVLLDETGLAGGERDRTRYAQQQYVTREAARSGLQTKCDQGNDKHQP